MGIANPRHRRDRIGRDVVTVRVITYAPTVFSHCQHCEVTFGQVGLGERVRRDEAANALPDDLAIDFARLSDWIRRIVERHGPRIHVEVIDAASVEGIVASFRHRVWRYPAVVVDGGRPVIGNDYDAVGGVIDRRLAAGPGPGAAPALARADATRSAHGEVAGGRQ